MQRQQQLLFEQCGSGVNYSTNPNIILFSKEEMLHTVWLVSRAQLRSILMHTACTDAVVSMTLKFSGSSCFLPLPIPPIYRPLPTEATVNTKSLSNAILTTYRTGTTATSTHRLYIRPTYRLHVTITILSRWTILCF